MIQNIKDYKFGQIYTNPTKEDLQYSFVSCICPTYNRRRFLPYLIYQFAIQDYPKNRRELIIVDDSKYSNIDLFQDTEYIGINDDVSQQNKEMIKDLLKTINVRYIYIPQRLALGAKRNLTNTYALELAEYIVCFDDDDYYPPQRIKKTIYAMKSQKKKFAGTSLLNIFYTSINKIYSIGPHGKFHCTNGTMAYHRDYLKNHKYDDNADKAEEKTFTDNFTMDMVQLNPLDTIICISHGSNTYNKQKLLGLVYLQEQPMPLKKIVKDPFLLNFYEQLCKENAEDESETLEEQQYRNHNIEEIKNRQLLVSRTLIENLYMQYNNNVQYQNFLKQLHQLLLTMSPVSIHELIDVSQGKKKIQHALYYELVEINKQRKDFVLQQTLDLIMDKYIKKEIIFYS